VKDETGDLKRKGVGAGNEKVEKDEKMEGEEMRVGGRLNEKTKKITRLVTMTMSSNSWLFFQTDVQSQTIDEAQKDFSMEIAVEMPFDIRKLFSPTHKLKMKVKAKNQSRIMTKNVSLLNIA
jgi:hypothetical protein